MNLYKITLKNEDIYYVVADEGNEALNKLNEWLIKYDKYFNWLKVENIATNWNEERIGIFE